MSAKKAKRNSQISSADSSMTSDTSTLTNGDVVWAPYRKSPAWPSIVSRVYPKKVTFHFLPLSGNDPNKKHPAFSCDPKKIRLFNESDQLPTNAEDDLVKAFKAARVLLGLEASKDSVVTSTKRAPTPSPTRQKAKGAETKALAADDDGKRKVSHEEETESFKHDDVVWIKMNNEPEWPAVIGQVFKKYVAFHFLPVTDQSKPRKVAKQHARKLDVSQVPQLMKETDDEDLKKALLSAQKLVEVKSDVDVIKSLTNGMGGGDSTETASNMNASTIPAEKQTAVTAPSRSSSTPRRSTRSLAASEPAQISQSTTQLPKVDLPSKRIPEENEWNVLTENSTSATMATSSVISSEEKPLPIKRKRPAGIQNGGAKKKKRAKEPSVESIEKKVSEERDTVADEGVPSSRVSTATDRSEEFVSLEKELRDKSRTPNVDDQLAVGDVAWAKYGRWPQWPVLITGYNRKRREYSYVFLPIKSLPFKEPKHKFRAKKLERFGDKYFDLYNASDVELAQAVCQAKEIQQGTLDPFAKLAENRDAQLLNRGVDANGSAETADLLNSSAHLSLLKTPEPDEAESSVQDSDTPPSTSSSATPPPTVLSDETRRKIAKRKARNEPLVDCALSSACKKHLLGVVAQQIECPRDAAWRSANSRKLKMSTEEANGGPVCDDDQVERIVDRLLEWLEAEMNELPTEARLPRTARFSYVVSVWLPEAVKFAMQTQWNYSADEAEDALSKPKEFFEEELIEIRQQMSSVAGTSHSPFDQLVAVACLKRSNEFVD